LRAAARRSFKADAAPAKERRLMKLRFERKQRLLEQS